MDERLRKLEIQTARIMSHLESEFGSGSTKGNMTQSIDRIERYLRDLNDKVGIQNGRIRKLEDFKTYWVGGIGTAGGLIAFVFYVLEKINI